MATDRYPQSPLTRQAAWLTRYRFGLRVREVGRVLSVGDGIVWITGQPSAAMDDLVSLDDGSHAMVFDLERDMVGAVLLHETSGLSAGTMAFLTRRSLQIAVGDGLLGRVVDPLGLPLDGAGPLKTQGHRKLENRSPPIIARDFVHQPLYTGIKVVDTLVPIGKGQRQLIVGDEGLGRSALALDTVINQRGKNVLCVYVLIGQKRSTVVQTIDTLRAFGALEYTTVVVAEASALPGLKHLAPFAGCAIAENWMEQGRDTLVVYDDLSAHARNYRELSLLLKRPPGREAYPGDIFSVHARLLERSTCLNAAHGGGSMTALPIVETQQGEIAAYVPTNLISITDGQIYLERNLFAAGVRPAIDIGKSVSRIGGAAQHPAIKREAASMKLAYLQFLELETFTRFGARLEASMEKAIKRGRVLREVLKQDRLAPIPVECQMAWLIAFNEGWLEDAALADVAPLLRKLERGACASSLKLSAPRKAWCEAVQSWLERSPKP